MVKKYPINLFFINIFNKNMIIQFTNKKRRDFHTETEPFNPI